MLIFKHFSEALEHGWHWPHFSPAELACHADGSLMADEGFLDKMELLRTVMKKPFNVVSGYRTPEYNAKVSGTGLTGPHTTGHAIDIRIAGPDAFDLVALAVNHGMTGIGVAQKGTMSGRFIHLDDLAGEAHPRPRIWTY